MMENSKITWTDHTFNPWIGCCPASAGCQNCYASADAKWAKFFGKDTPRHITSDAYWKKPLRWNKEAFENGTRYRVFCGSYCDVFENRADVENKRYELFGLIDRTPNLDWLLLTKRPENIKSLWPWGWYDDQYSWPNIWLGTTVENQKQANIRIPQLLEIPAKVRFISCEPLLEEVNLLSIYCNGALVTWKTAGAVECVDEGGIHWVIIGGESGSNRRPMDIAWMQSLKEQCSDAGVPVFIKQDSAHKPGQQGQIPDELWAVKEFPNV